MMMRYLGGGVGQTRYSLLDLPPPLENIEDEADLSDTVSTPWERMQYHKNPVSDSDSEGDELSSSTPEDASASSDMSDDHARDRAGSDVESQPDLTSSVDESEDAIDEGESEDAIDEGDEVYTY
jgi:hypothetical protein